MEVIKQTVKVKNNKLIINLPDNFNSDKVEVTIVAIEDEFVITDEMKQILDARSKEDITTFISAEESILRLRKRIYVQS